MTDSELAALACKLRLEAVKMVYRGKDGHPGPALSIADLVTVLYFDVMRLDPARPDWQDRDRFIVSKGHACPIVYAALSEKGYFGKPVDDFKLRELGSIFQGHPVMGKTPGIDMTSGSLGNGLAIGAGMAWAGKRLGKDFHVYVIVGDGEMQEGVVWEGVNIGTARKLDNLTVLVDRNGWQSGGGVKDVIGDNNLDERLAAFGWAVETIDGHDIGAIRAALGRARASRGKPTAIVCNTVKGKGCSFMENDNAWHKGVPTDAQFEEAVRNLGGK